MKRYRRLPAARVDEWLLPAFFVAAFLLGGGARADTLSLLILRPLAVIFAALGLILTMRSGGSFVRHRFILGVIATSMLVIALHLIPLPYAVWSALPGREVLVQADQIGGIGQIWRPLTMVPNAAWNALFSLFVPLAVYSCWLVLPAERRRILLPLLIGIGVASAVLGVIQIATDQFYFYRLTTLGAPVGLFANRNHQAVFLTLLIPMMATYASLATEERVANRRKIAAIATGLALIPMLLVVGSRAGLLAMVIATIAAIGLYRAPLRAPKRRKKRPIWIIGIAIGAGVAALAFVSVLFARMDAFTRLLQTGGDSEVRSENWKVVVDILGQYMPFGSGAGSFVEVFQIHEPFAQIKYTYFNHAHNEPLEIALTLGVPGLLLLAVAFFGWARVSVTLWRAGKARDWRIMFGQLGAVMMLILGLASIVDYPARTPSLAALLTLAALWMAMGWERANSNQPTRDGETRNGG